MNQRISYAQVTKVSVQPQQANYPKIIIKPKEPQNHQKQRMT